MDDLVGINYKIWHRFLYHLQDSDGVRNETIPQARRISVCHSNINI